MNRRKFLKTAAVAASLAVLPLEFPDAEELHWAAFRRRLTEIRKRGYDVQGFALYREEEGFRYCVLEVEGQSPVTWYQPWGRNVDVDVLEHENRIYDSSGCAHCGQRSLQQHRCWCKRALSLFET